MELIQELVPIISNVGFPIVCCGALMWFCNKTIKEVGNTINDLKAIVEKNTDVLKEVLWRLKMGGSNGEE